MVLAKLLKQSEFNIRSIQISRRLGSLGEDKMDFALSEEQQAIFDMAYAFGQDEIACREPF